MLVGVEAYGPCGFSLHGSTGAHASNRVISCEDIDQVELPFLSRSRTASTALPKRETRLSPGFSFRCAERSSAAF
jgi:hypothetical protein